MAVPSDLAAGSNVEAAHAQVMIGDGDLFLGEIDLTEQLLVDVLVGRRARLLAVGRRFLAGRTWNQQWREPRWRACRR